MGELSKKLESFGHMVKIYKNIFDGVDKDTHVPDFYKWPSGCYIS